MGSAEDMDKNEVRTTDRKNKKNGKKQYLVMATEKRGRGRKGFCEFYWRQLL